jgi:predicted phosphodiesterase
MGLEEMVKQILVMADEHAPHIDERMARITKDYAANNREDIQHVVLLGDGVDNPGMSFFPERPDNKYTLQEEVDEYVRHLSDYAKILPNAKFHYIHGNHCKGRLDSTKNIKKSMAGLRNLKFEKIMQESMQEQGIKLDVDFQDNLVLWDTMFVHGDPRIDPYIKGGATGVRRTAEMYPFQGNLVMGHKHQVISYPRVKGDSSVYVVGAMFNIKDIAQQYKSYHGYQNGFMVVSKDGKNLQFDNIEVKKGPLYIDGGIYD